MMQFPMNPLMNQTFQNVAAPNIQIPGMAPGTGTCDQQLQFAGTIFVGLAQAFFQARDLLEEVRTLAAAEGLTDVATELANAELLNFGPTPTVPPLATCEERLALGQQLIGGVVDIFDTRFAPAFALSFQFLRARTDQPGVSDLLNRIGLFVAQTSATILDAARRFVPLTLR